MLKNNKRKYSNYNDIQELETFNKIKELKFDDNKKNIIKKDNSFLLLYGLI